ncbi:CRISPR-associated endonuclease Cas9 [Tenacibaculum sp. 190524A02b]|uniref:CRISPR-associated endonuclease Cas9 n=1 Tax=Tenacibaculum vairaonense TaxID=3137860 RepID=A0ABP1FD45_9FLAO
MKKRILGLDLGITSIGWALVDECDSKASEIIKLGVRVNPLSADEKLDFEKGRPLTTNADRTLKRSARRNLHRFKLRRANLIAILIEHGFITKDSYLTEVGKDSTHTTLRLRAKAAKGKISLPELARVLLAINKKRGYKSSRKVNEDEGVAIDSMAIAKELYENQQTPGEFVLTSLEKGTTFIPDFYKSDLQVEFDAVWQFQQSFYPDILDTDLYNALKNQGLQNTRKRFLAMKGIYTADNKGKKQAVTLQHYTWRNAAIKEQLTIEEVAYVLAAINNDLTKSSGYLGAISDRSKELYFNKKTVGEYLYNRLQKSPHSSLKNLIFYRQDYLDEFEQIWLTQSQFYPQLTLALKEEIRDVIIFYQRALKSQKGLLSFCPFESWEENYIDSTTKKEKTRTIGRKVIAKSSPLFQEFKIWQNLNNLIFENEIRNERIVFSSLDSAIRMLVFDELNLRGTLKPTAVLKLLAKHITSIGKVSTWKCNFEQIEGNITNKALFSVYEKIAEIEGYGHDWAKKTASAIKEELTHVFTSIGIDTDILHFDALKASHFDAQPAYQLWHLLYATEEDNKVSKEDVLLYGATAVSLKKKLVEKFGFTATHAKLLASVSFTKDYGNLSSKAIRKILPYLQAGHSYSRKDVDGNGIGACELAGYNAARNLTNQEKLQKEYAATLALVKKNSLRNPVVEKILNQMVNLVNQVITHYGKPDVIRIELARELKKNAKERALMSKNIAEATKRNENIKRQISKDFKIPNPTKNDVIRYRLWQELATNGYKDVFTNTKINYEDLFSKHIDIEHIIPKSVLFDDSFSNKTLAFKAVNIQKSNRTALDFISDDYATTIADYKTRVASLYSANGSGFSKAKCNKLLMTKSELPDGFIERDLRNSQYIAKKAKELLETVFEEVYTTSGKITDKLREDWDLINVMKELNLPKYKALGLTTIEKRLDKGTQQLKEVEVITDWTKRNDHRHHAMDALTIAFTTNNHIQYINNLHARKNERHDKHASIFAIEQLITSVNQRKNGAKKRIFTPPIPNFRSEAKKHLETILVSYKHKNKVVTNSINTIKIKNGVCKKIQLTPRGQLHKETIYGTAKRVQDKPTALNKRFSLSKAHLIVNPSIKKQVLEHLKAFNNDAAVAFSAKTFRTHPLTFKGSTLKEVVCFEEVFTIRKAITPDLKIDKVIDSKIKVILYERLASYDNNATKAFSNLDTNPIWLNKEKGICIKRVTITGVSNALPLHYKKNHLGHFILDTKGVKKPVDFVSTGNNHHVAFYRDKNGKIQENMVSFFEAVTRATKQLPIIDKGYNKGLGWQFLFTMKQNEFFVFPSGDFMPTEIDLLDVNNTALISKNLYYVQSISVVRYGNSVIRDFIFRHHLDSSKKEVKGLKNHTFFHIKSLDDHRLQNCVKVRLNHIGKVIQVGEF